MKSKLLSLTGTLLLALGAGSGQADDIDIYYTAAAATPPDEPIVMFSLDWRPNLGSTACQGGECQTLIDEGYMSAVGPYTFFDVLRGVLRKVMEPLTGVKVGLMMNHDYKNNCGGKVQSGCSDGGFIALGARSFDKTDSNGAKDAFHNYLSAVPTPQGNASHTYQGKELFFELYRYLTAQKVYNGHVGFLDFKTPSTANMDVDTPLTMWDTSVEVGPVNNPDYITPLTPGGRCAKVFTVNLMFQVSQQEDDSDPEIKKTVAQGGMNLDGPTFPGVLGWLNDVDLADGKHGAAPDMEGLQNVISYFIVDPTKINAKTTGYAQAGGTGVPLALDTDPDKLVATLSDIFKQILSVSTTFVAASIPVNVFNRSEVIDNVYIALFEPDEAVTPFWNGNVKKLKIGGLAAGSPTLVDATDQPAIAADGRVRFDVLTLWTDPAALPPPDPDKSEVAGKDGRSVARGGAGQKFRDYAAAYPGQTNAEGHRRLYYQDGGDLVALNYDDTTATALETALGAADQTEAKELIGWARGLDIDDEDGDSETVDEARYWFFGDPLHSRPLPINFGARGGYTQANQAIYIAVASNDGFIRMIRNTTTAGAQSGEEIWGIMPEAVMPKIKTLRQNPVGVRHPYLIDGAPVAYLKDANNNGTLDAGEDAWLYVAMRRGGRNLYALDISDPENPSILWTIEPGGDFGELGYTFSNPRVINIDIGAGEQPALMFGGGYDLNKDLRGGVGTDDSEGTAVFVVDAKTGDLIWKAVGSGSADSETFVHADMVDSIPSGMAIMDSDGDGKHDRAYAGDTGGKVWRIDMFGGDTNLWKASVLANLGRHDPAAGGIADDRRFFHRPDIVQSADKDGPYDAVVIGAGDRADPLDGGGLVENFAYMIKDRAFKAGTGSDTGLVHASFGDVTNTCLTADGPCTADLTNGWTLGLAIEGEKALSTPLTVGGVVYFTSYIKPGLSSEGACGPDEGSGRQYAVSLTDASAVNNYDSTTDEAERFSELDSKGIPAEVVSLPPKSVLRPDLKVERTNAPTRFQTYWFEEEDGDL